jgi:Ca2+-binding EF-hand superfamily protein
MYCSFVSIEECAKESFFGRRRRRSTTVDMFDAVDVNHDGKIDRSEANSYLNDQPRPLNWFESMDTNGDGFVQPNEFDNTL